VQVPAYFGAFPRTLLAHVNKIVVEVIFGFLEAWNCEVVSFALSFDIILNMKLYFDKSQDTKRG
jgi:hypothetical protein